MKKISTLNNIIKLLMIMFISISTSVAQTIPQQISYQGKLGTRKKISIPILHSKI